MSSLGLPMPGTELGLGRFWGGAPLVLAGVKNAVRLSTQRGLAAGAAPIGGVLTLGAHRHGPATRFGVVADAERQLRSTLWAAGVDIRRLHLPRHRRDRRSERCVRDRGGGGGGSTAEANLVSVSTPHWRHQLAAP